MSESERSYGGRSAAERAAVRRERLVAATIATLAGGGEPGTTMTAICAEAGLTERYFYESFRNRDEAMVAALDSVATEMTAAALSALTEHAGDPSRQVRAAITAVVDLIGDSPAKGRVAVVESTGTAALRARRHQLLAGFAELVGDEAQHVFGAAAWPPERARLHGLLFAAGFAEVLASWLGEELPLSRAELVDLGSDLLHAVQQRR
ncbi:TetR/AcrR family transcriptional regulator [Nocardioides sp. 616]|uniref:TetR/AcrR family transcriptional regulator n=1 Tax=Nocardioides sp. 616 TaxID=2268090 RepID=UPI000CE3227F|nr:TetR/AcrR family transcriptional regulator [Nocardioides sp. 616]